jgi:hypothetical protein
MLRHGRCPGSPFAQKVARITASKVTGTGLSIAWLAPDRDAGSYTLGPRKDAVIFPTQADAQAAVVKASEAYGQLGMVSSVEFAD